MHGETQAHAMVSHSRSHIRTHTHKLAHKMFKILKPARTHTLSRRQSAQLHNRGVHRQTHNVTLVFKQAHPQNVLAMWSQCYKGCKDTPEVSGKESKDLWKVRWPLLTPASDRLIQGCSLFSWKCWLHRFHQLMFNLQEQGGPSWHWQYHSPVLESVWNYFSSAFQCKHYAFASIILCMQHAGRRHVNNVRLGVSPVKRCLIHC